MRSCFLFLGAISALVGVGMGAFGAHGLKAVLSVEQLTIFQTAVTYQMWHALGLLGIGIIYQQVAKSNLLIWAGWLMFNHIFWQLISAGIVGLKMVRHDYTNRWRKFYSSLDFNRYFCRTEATSQ